MSSIQFFPIHWFEPNSWNSMQVWGRLANGNSVYLRIAFRPYFTVRYHPNTNPDNLEESHGYLLSETPIVELTRIQVTNPELTQPEIEKGLVYRVYLRNRDDYNSAVKFFEENKIAEILDRDQDIKSKFFAERLINPGSWQQASNLQTLLHNMTANGSYTSADLEYYTTRVFSIESDLPPPQGVLGIFDIEAISNDNVSFPDADHPPDHIFAISLVTYSYLGPEPQENQEQDMSEYLENTVYFLTHHPDRITPDYQTLAERTGQSYRVKVVPVNSEKELLEKFFEGLRSSQPDRLVSMNGRHFDINYIGARARVLGVRIPPFSKILTYQPYFNRTTLIQHQPFFSVEEVWAIRTPGISQIDLLDFYRRLYPQLGSHRLEILTTLILGRGKTGLTVPEMFMRYRRGNKEDYDVIIDYSITDSIRLAELWRESSISQELSNMSNMWKNDADYVITTVKEELFNDLIRYITPVPPSRNNQPGKPPSVERAPGIHRNVYLYSLSSLYQEGLLELGDPLATLIAGYFEGSGDALIPFKSGYFPTHFSRIITRLQTISNPEDWVWIEENNLAIRGSSPELPTSKDYTKDSDSYTKDADRYIEEDKGPIPSLPLIDRIPLVIVVNKSWILVNSAGLIFKKGLSSVVRPPFQLLARYIDYLVQYLVDHPDSTEPVVFPEMPTELEDFVLEMKIKAEDFSSPSDAKAPLIAQLQEIGAPVTTSWRKVRYIRLLRGLVIEEIYSQDLDRYVSQIDGKWYNNAINRAINSITTN